MVSKIVLRDGRLHFPAIRNKEFFGDGGITIEPRVVEAGRALQHMEEDVEYRLPEPRAAFAKQLFEQCKNRLRIYLDAVIDQCAFTKQHQVNIKRRLLAAQKPGNGREAVFRMLKAGESR